MPNYALRMSSKVKFGTASARDWIRVKNGEPNLLERTPQLWIGESGQNTFAWCSNYLQCKTRMCGSARHRCWVKVEPDITIVFGYQFLALLEAIGRLPNGPIVWQSSDELTALVQH